MTRYTISIRSQAVAELREAFEFIRADSPRNAVAWLKGMWNAIDSLETMPQRCPFARERLEIGADVRQFLYHSHRILFTVERNRVVIHHIRHAKMDSIRKRPGTPRPTPRDVELSL